MEKSAKEYLSSGDSTKLITDKNNMLNILQNIFWKENNKLFMMAES